MIPVGDDSRSRSYPYLVWSLLLVLVVIYLWDRGWDPMGDRLLFADLALRPSLVVSAFQGGEKWPVATLFTSCFLHGNLAHLLGNLLYLWVFGPRIERTFGSFLFALYYMFWGVIAGATQLAMMPSSTLPMVGASGAIAGVMGSYFLLYPGARISVLVPVWPFWWVFHWPAWLMLGLWFVLQIVVVQPGVANWAHAGGFLAGMLVVLLTGAERRRDHLRVRGRDFWT
jgi:membrane associated rhomboid family serine protease